MVQDVMLTSIKGKLGVRFSKEIASKIAEELFYETLFFRFLPEIKGVEEGKIKAKKVEKQLNFWKRFQ